MSCYAWQGASRPSVSVLVRRSVQFVLHRARGVGAEEQGRTEPHPPHLAASLPLQQQQSGAGDALQQQGRDQAQGVDQVLMKWRGRPRSL